MSKKHDWVACQLGAREHYSIPRALHGEGLLDTLMTDAWVPPRSPWGAFRRNLRERHHPMIPENRVSGFTSGAVAFELNARLRGWQGWEGILRRNQWFQSQVVKGLERGGFQARHHQEKGTLFSFSYTALEPFRWAKQHGWKTVLGQIDGAIADQLHIASLYERNATNAGEFRTAPDAYWRQWREECELADSILVNSAWSRELLIEGGIRENKIEIVPLAYSAPEASQAFHRDYPSGFDDQRPLRVLFLGQISARKGVLELLEAARSLEQRPVEFWMVGPEVFAVPQSLRGQENVKWIGAVPRGRAAELYRNADVFVFPSHSDGFGLTQLEAQAWKLPLIASRHCGRVVRPGINGLELAEVNPDAIAKAIDSCQKNPDLLGSWSKQADDLSGYSIARLANRLQSLP